MARVMAVPSLGCTIQPSTRRIGICGGRDGAKKPITYIVFDLLHLNGHNLRNLPLIDRKSLLATLLKNPGKFIHLSEHIESNGPAVFKGACELDAEGIISKRAAGAYISGRTGDWLKAKCIREQEFVIGGFTLPAKGHAGIHGVGALLLGYYRDGACLPMMSTAEQLKQCTPEHAWVLAPEKTDRILTNLTGRYVAAPNATIDFRPQWQELYVLEPMDEDGLKWMREKHIGSGELVGEPVSGRRKGVTWQLHRAVLLPQ